MPGGANIKGAHLAPFYIDLQEAFTVTFQEAKMIENRSLFTLKGLDSGKRINYL
jgi:hypothetical protein